MMKQLQTVLAWLIQGENVPSALQRLGLGQPAPPPSADEAAAAQQLNRAFLVALAGLQHPAAGPAARQLEELSNGSRWGEVARFYREGLRRIEQELESVCREDSEFAGSLQQLAESVSKHAEMPDSRRTEEALWSVFFPEAVGIRDQEQHRVAALRQRRGVEITRLNPEPISEPARQILFTSNVLLTVPSDARPLAELGLPEPLTEELGRACHEPQRFWYDHPIPIGITPESNEVLYGLRGLEEALDFERQRGNVSPDGRLTCLLSVSVTHHGLRKIAKPYLDHEFSRHGGFEHLDVYIFTEQDTDEVARQLLVPAAEGYLPHADIKPLLSVFGVDGHYGRHYSFLKAITALWNVFVDPGAKATFKIDLDQVFPQKELVEESGRSALEHFTTPRWGAHGVDSSGRPIELGMIAGALVNERDISQSLFTADVRFPTRPLAADEYVFFSTLPQALSTEAEMMARYDGPPQDGRARCLERIHVTGGTNGILIDALRRHRPFTPTFIGRAEDQAYLLSSWATEGPRLGYAHQPGLIMRHDKEAFAQEAINVARVGKLIGDYVRILYFSAYARALGPSVPSLKQVIDPFTGCFVSKIPTTVVYLRFALKAASLFAGGAEKDSLDFIRLGSQRLTKALEFAAPAERRLKQAYEQERIGWGIYYDILAAVETALRDGDPLALALREKAVRLVQGCAVKQSTTSGRGGGLRKPPSSTV
jgi:hypothetical protein